MKKTLTEKLTIKYCEKKIRKSNKKTKGRAYTQEEIHTENFYRLRLLEIDEHYWENKNKEVK